MRNILNIALADLRLNFAPSVILAAILPPVILTVVIGLAFQTSPNTYRIDIVRTGDDPLAAQFINVLRNESGEGFVYCDLASGEHATACNMDDLKPGDDLTAYAKNRVQKGTTLGAVTIPADFSATIAAGKPASIGFINNASQNSSGLVRQKIDSAVTQINGAVIAGRVLRDKSNGDQAVYDEAYTSAAAIWATDPVKVDEQVSATAGSNPGGFGQSASGMGLMFVMSFVLGISVVFIRERQEGTLQRLFILPVTRAQILAGKLLGRYLFGVVNFAVIVVVGLAFKVSWGDPVGVILTLLLYTLAITAIGLALSTVVRSSAQSSGVQLLLTLTLAPLGGAWWPLSIVPSWMQTLGRISPIAWAQDAFTKLIFYNGHLVDILPGLAVLAGFAVVFFVIGITRFKYE